MANAKTPGQLAYEAELVYAPTYPCGRPRIAWDDLVAKINDLLTFSRYYKRRGAAMGSPHNSERRPYHETPRNIHRDFPKRQMGDI
jgi:hypothetical protein